MDSWFGNGLLHRDDDGTRLHVAQCRSKEAEGRGDDLYLGPTKNSCFIYIR